MIRSEVKKWIASHLDPVLFDDEDEDVRARPLPSSSSPSPSSRRPASAAAASPKSIAKSETEELVEEESYAVPVTDSLILYKQKQKVPYYS